MELAFREQLSEIILDGIPSEVCWLVLGSALGYTNFVLDAFGSGQALPAVIPLAALGLATVLATPALCLQGLFDRAPSRVLGLLATCASVLLLACPLATSVLCTTTPCSDGDGWRLTAAAQDALLVVSVVSALFAGLPTLHGCLPVLVTTAAQAVVLAVRREILFGEHYLAIECLRRGSCLVLLLLIVVFGARRREALDRASFLTAEGGVELQMALLQQPVRPLPPPAPLPTLAACIAPPRRTGGRQESQGPEVQEQAQPFPRCAPRHRPPPAHPSHTSTHPLNRATEHGLCPPELSDGASHPPDAHPSPKDQCYRRCDLRVACPPELPSPLDKVERPCCAVPAGSEGGQLATGLARALDLLEQSAAKSTDGGYTQAEVDWTRSVNGLVSACWV